MKILVCDDYDDQGNRVVDELRAAGYRDSKPLTEDSLTAELTSLFERVKKNNKRNVEYEHESSQFDEADILLLDNNLTHLNTGGGPPLTAESIAGYLRAFTKARYIVSLNMKPEVDFDLRYLVGDVSTRADLAVNTKHVTNNALWTGRPKDATAGFCPWYWPRLQAAAKRRQAQIEFVENHLDDRVCATFGFDDEDLLFFSRHAQGALSPKAESLAEVRFRDVFLDSDRSLPIKDDRLKFDDATRHGNRDALEAMCRVVAAEVDLWFRRDVVAPQEVLVDTPHLVTRLPFLLGHRAGDIGQWNAVVDIADRPFGFEPGLYEKHLEAVRFEHDIWVPRPCFRWPRLKADEKLNERFFGAKRQRWADVVFCEDESQFRQRSSEPMPAEFVAEFEGAWNRRYIAWLGPIRYAPLTRLAA